MLHTFKTNHQTTLPLITKFYISSSQRLSISFVFFVHGDTVCASIDLREHSAVKLLTQEYLADAAAATSQHHQQQQQSSHINTTSPLLSASLQHGSASAAAASIASSDVQQNMLFLRRTVCPQYSLEIVLRMVTQLLTSCSRTGAFSTHCAILITQIFHLLLKLFLVSFCFILSLITNDTPFLSPTGGYKMSYPSKFVLVTELDESATANSSNMSNQTDNNSDSTSSPHNKSGVFVAPQPSSSPNNNNSKSRISPKKTFKDLKTLSKYENSNYNNFNNHNNINTHAPLSVAIELPERVWQDCITHPIKSAAAVAATFSATNASSSSSNVEQQSPVPPTSSSSSSSTSSANNVVVKQEPLDGIMNPEDIKTEPGLSENQDTTNNSTANDNLSSNNNNNNNNINSTDSKKLWDFVDPTRKTTCICAR